MYNCDESHTFIMTCINKMEDKYEHSAIAAPLIQFLRCAVFDSYSQYTSMFNV